jgi:hypothetical protein
MTPMTRPRSSSKGPPLVPGEAAAEKRIHVHAPSCLLACASVPALNYDFSPLVLAAVTTGILAVVAVWESIALRTP